MRWMQRPRAAAVLVALAIGAAPPQAAAVADGSNAPVVAPDGATIFRVFLTDGTSLVSYGEPARVGERIVFSMPTTSSLDNPPLHLVNLAASRVDWARTERYAEAARAARYIAESAETDYAALTSQVASALADVSATADPLARLAIVEKARRTLAEWPRTHFNYREADIAPMLGMLDEIVAELRALSGAGQFDLSFVARTAAPAASREPLLPLPSARETVEQVMAAAAASDSAAERLSLLTMALGTIEREAVLLSGEWRTRMRATIRASITAELEVDRQYRLLTDRVLALAAASARAADVRGVQRLVDDLAARDRALGSQRPDAVAGLAAALEAQLDAARRLRLARDRWALRQADFKAYNTRMTAPLARLARVRQHLDDIKAMVGSSPFALAAIQRGAGQATRALSAIAPPDELRSAHALFVSAAQLADTAAKIRMEAALTGDLRRAWDASSAAAGALMLDQQARAELRSVSRVPQLPQ